MGNPVVHFEVLGKNGPELISFYADAFGWKIDAANPFGYGVVDTQGGRGINGGVGAAQEGSPAHVTVYVAVADHDAVLRTAEELGAKTILPTSDVMDGVRIALFADPSGNVVGLVNEVTDGDQPPGPSAGSGNPVTWFEIAGSDGSALRDFYGRLFGWTFKVDDKTEYAEVHADRGISGGLTPGRDAYATFYVEVPDVKAALDRVTELGAKTLVEPLDVGGNVVVAQFADPAGNRVGLWAETP